MPVIHWKSLAGAVVLAAGSLQSLAVAADSPSWKAGPGVVAYADRAVGDTYIVLHQAAPLATYAGGMQGLPATSAAATGRSRLDLESSAATTYLDFLGLQLDALVSAAEAALGRSLNVEHRMFHALTGFTARMTPEEAARVAALPGVRRVEAPILFELQSDNGPAWIQSDAVYDGSATVDGVGTMGEGVVVGVIDSGVNFDHPSFAAVGPVDGYVHTNPRTLLGLPRYYGLCLPVVGLPFLQ